MIYFSSKICYNLLDIKRCMILLSFNIRCSFLITITVGLDNLGNTCYLNSSLQALLHTEPLVDYFLGQRYLKDVNIDSRYGFNGRLAYIFGILTRKLWTSTKPSISPNDFLKELTVMFEQFSGREQHDAQEFLSVLLDGLHEDLNLVTEKPYTDLPDSDDKPDPLLAGMGINLLILLPKLSYYYLNFVSLVYYLSFDASTKTIALRS